MSRIESIVNLVDALVVANFGASKIKYWGLCHQEERDGNNIPVKYIGSGDVENVSFDDKYALAFYHRITSEDESKDSNLGFGTKLQVVQTYNMKLVVFANSRNLKSEQTDLSYALRNDVCSIIPSSLTSAQLTILDAQSGFINIGAKDIDKRAVFSTEMGETEFKVGPEHILFAINYSVRLTFLESCLSTTTYCDTEVPLPIPAEAGTNPTFCQMVLACASAPLEFTAPLVEEDDVVSMPRVTRTEDGYLDNEDFIDFQNASDLFMIKLMH